MQAQPRNAHGRFTRRGDANTEELVEEADTNSEDEQIGNPAYTKKETEGILFAAATVDRLAQGHEFTETWVANAQSRRTVILSAARKANTILESTQESMSETPATIMRRLQLFSNALATPTRKRQATRSPSADEDSDNGDYISVAPLENPFISLRKSSKTDTTAKEPAWPLYASRGYRYLGYEDLRRSECIFGMVRSLGSRNFLLSRDIFLPILADSAW